MKLTVKKCTFSTEKLIALIYFGLICVSARGAFACLHPYMRQKMKVHSHFVFEMCFILAHCLIYRIFEPIVSIELEKQKIPNNKYIFKNNTGNQTSIFIAKLPIKIAANKYQ